MGRICECAMSFHKKGHKNVWIYLHLHVLSVFLIALKVNGIAGPLLEKTVVHFIFSWAIKRECIENPNYLEAMDLTAVAHGTEIIVL